MPMLACSVSLLLVLPKMATSAAARFAMETEPLAGPGDWDDMVPSFPSFENLHQELFDVWPETSSNLSHAVLGFSNPYKLRADFRSFPHSYLAQELFASVVDYLGVGGPHFIVEVGSFHGHSAVVMARFLTQLGIKATPILCIDPFTGDANIWSRYRKDRVVRRWVKIRDGRLLAYDQFMVNIQRAIRSYSISSRLILPFQTTSTVGARWLHRMGFTPDLIFLDSAHEEHETFLEISLFYRVLAPGGIMFGDDYSWPPVQRDVEKFVTEQAARGSRWAVEFHRVRSSEGSLQLFWVIRKPKRKRG